MPFTFLVVTDGKDPIGLMRLVFAMGPRVGALGVPRPELNSENLLYAYFKPLVLNHLDDAVFGQEKVWAAVGLSQTEHIAIVVSDLAAQALACLQ